MIKKTLLLVLFPICAFANPNLPDCEGRVDQVSHEVIYDFDQSEVDELSENFIANGYPAGAQTYRIYAELDGVCTVVQAVLGTPSVNMMIGTNNGHIYNYSYLGAEALLGEDNNESLDNFQDVYMLDNYDSFVTIGSVSNLNPMGQQPVTAFTGVPGVDYNLPEDWYWNNSTYNDQVANIWTANNSGWLLTNVDAPNAYGIGPDLKVVLAQITTTGELRYALNIMTMDGLPSEGGNMIYTTWDGESLPVAEMGDIQMDGSDIGFLFPILCSDPLACNYTGEEYWANNAGCEYSCTGCTDETACNYSEEAPMDDGSCEGLIGCNEETATNYNPSATCNDYSCTFTIEGLVFYDENNNGLFDGDDFGIEGHEVYLDPLGISVFTDASGVFAFSDMNLNAYLVAASPHDSYSFHTTPSFIEFTLNSSGEVPNLEFGLSEIVQPFDLDVEISTTPEFCNGPTTQSIQIANWGSENLSGQVIFILDELAQSFIEVYPIDSVIEDSIYFSFDELLFGDELSIEIELTLPDPDFSGELMTNEVEVIGQNDGDIIAFGAAEYNWEVQCSYDPNDIQVFPSGFSSEHLILPNQELNYLIRFQNTGDIPATYVRVLNDIDPNLDLSSFELVNNSHPVEVLIYEDQRSIEFFFDQIMLADSTSNEEESHGFVEYTISPAIDLEENEEIHNGVGIIFDFNEPVITNTVFNTIYYCDDEMSDFVLNQESYCEGEEIIGTSSEPYIEDYYWFLNSSLLEIEENYFSIDAQFLDPTQDIILLAANPICSSRDTIEFTVNQLPDVSIIADEEVCLGDSLFVQGEGEGELNWVLGDEFDLYISPLDDTLIVLASTDEFQCYNETYHIIEVNPLPTAEIIGPNEICSGDTAIFYGYGAEELSWTGIGVGDSIHVFSTNSMTIELLATNEFGCVNGSSFDLLVNENPLPTIDESDFLLSTDMYSSYQWFNQNGEITGATEQEYLVDESGQYYVHVVDENGCEGTSTEIDLVYIGVEEIERLFNIYPIPADDFIFYSTENKEIARLRILNTGGQVLLDESIQNSAGEIQVSTLATGFYILEIINKNNQTIDRVEFIIE